MSLCVSASHSSMPWQSHSGRREAGWRRPVPSTRRTPETWPLAQGRTRGARCRCSRSLACRRKSRPECSTPSRAAERQRARGRNTERREGGRLADQGSGYAESRACRSRRRSTVAVPGGPRVLLRWIRAERQPPARRPLPPEQRVQSAACSSHSPSPHTTDAARPFVAPLERIGITSPVCASVRQCHPTVNVFGRIG